LAHCFERIKNKKYLSVSLFIVIVFEQMNTTPSYDKWMIRRDVESLASRIPSSCKTFLFTSVASQEASYKLQLDAIWAGTARGLPTMNGLSGNEPHDWGLSQINHEANEKDVESHVSHWTSKTGITLDPHCWIRTELPLQE
jgi:hypothetical protein